MYGGIMNTRKAVFPLLLVLTIISLSFQGCATIFHGSTDTVNFTSEPSGASIYVDGISLGKTPFQTNLKSNKNYNIEFRLDGYNNRNVVLNNSVSGGYIVLDVLFGIFPVVIDAATGNWYSLDMDQVHATLEKK